MFSKKKSQLSNNNNIVKLSDFSVSRSIPSIIVSDLAIKGDLISKGAVEIGGEVKGNIRCSFVTVRKGSNIIGDIYADNLVINGKVNGVIRAKNVSVTSSADVEGLLYYNYLNVESGADIKGRLIKEKSEENITDANEVNEFIPQINGILAYNELPEENLDLSLDKTLEKVRKNNAKSKKAKANK
jgi:cytoskeletal protein CcmA (bactofilin family)